MLRTGLRAICPYLRSCLCVAAAALNPTKASWLHTGVARPYIGPPKVITWPVTLHVVKGCTRTEAVNIDAVLAPFVYSLPVTFQSIHIGQTLHLHTVRWFRSYPTTVNALWNGETRTPVDCRRSSEDAGALTKYATNSS